MRLSNCNARATAAGALAAALLAPLAGGQVTARQADDGDVQVENPMLLTIDLPLSLATTLDAPPYDSARRMKMCTGRQWTAPSTARFVVDKARITNITVKRGHNVKKREHFIVELDAGSGWFRQDLDITIRLLRDGVELRRHFEDDLTVGNQKMDGTLWAGASGKRMTAAWEVKPGEFEGWFAGAESMVLEVKVFVDDE